MSLIPSSRITVLENESLVSWEEGDLIFCRGWRSNADGSQTAVLVLRYAGEHPTPASLGRFAHEFNLKRDLDSAWAALPLELVREHGQNLLVLEDFGGEPLGRMLGRPLEPGLFLHLAIGIATALGKVHQRGLIHKDIKPANILVNSATSEVKLTGFGIASRLPRERQSPAPPERIAGTLPYMAPEQTGRMNRSIDLRSDLYALGVTLYEMLTGSLPFAAGDSMGWIHCHIARQPVSPAERVRSLPMPVSEIVLKLLCKAAEDRYQTAAGLEWDLRKCLTDWKANHRIDMFPLGKHDTAQQLLIPEKLYGRDIEIRTLMRAFERVVTQAKPELVLVSGDPGIGKSSVVNELHKVIALPRGIFISGKFDLHLRGTPYSTLVQAFQGLIRQILNGQQADIACWSDAIRQAIGKHGRLLTETIPELAALIGPQPPVPPLSPLETRVRFQSVFQRFVSVFSRAEHPLVIFIDDLQWLDPETLSLIEYLATQPDTHYLLLIGAYRDNEVTDDHPLMGTLRAIRSAGTAVHEVVLSQLSVEDFDQLLCDALRCHSEQSCRLSALVHEKTGGNPFFAGQFLTNLVEEGLLRFEPTSSSWRWSLECIDAKGFTNNVVDLMIRRLQRLSSGAQDALKLLACLGNEANFATLAKLRGGSEAQIQAEFAEAVRGGSITSTDRSFRFLHDQAQEAAYALIPVELRPEYHLRIGQLLLSSLGQDEVAARLFDLVNQLNLGRQLIFDREEQRHTAVLNLQAAKKAKASAAYSSACTYLEAAEAVLGQKGWEDSYPLTFNVWLERAECEFFNSSFGEAAWWIDELLVRAQSRIDRAETYRLRMVHQLLHGDNAAAVRTALECLLMFDIELQERPTDEQVWAECDAMWRDLGGHRIGSLLDLPTMENPEMRVVMHILSTVALSAYYVDSNLCQTIVFRMVHVTQKYGTTESAVLAYGGVGIFLGPFFYRYKDGEEFCRLAIAVSEKHGFVAQKVEANFLMQMTLLWTHPIESALKFLNAAIRCGQETGEIVFACYSLEHRLTDILLRGDQLDEVWLEGLKALKFTERMKFRHVGDIVGSTQSFIQKLRGHTDATAVIDEASLEARQLEGGNVIVICFHWILQIQRHFLFGDPVAALEYAANAKPLLWSTRCHVQSANYWVYSSLALASVHGAVASDRQAAIRAEITVNIEALQRVALSCPMTFAHKHLLVCGELARLEGRETEALQIYEQAALWASERGFIQDQALANELAGQCCLAQQLERAAQAYLREARDCYCRWGALGKVAQLDERYPSIRPSVSPGLRGTIEESTERLDVAAIARTAQAISGEMVLEDLIKSLMTIALEHAGAERGLLILQHGTQQQIESEAIIQCDSVVVRPLGQFAGSPPLPELILRYVSTTRECVILDDASDENRFSADPYIRQCHVRSVLCLPLLKQAKLIGVLYLENNLVPGVFAPAQTTVLKLLAPQAAIALENARLYRDLAEREAKIRRLVDANIIGIVIWNLKGQIIEANDAFLRVLGYERGELVSSRLGWADLTPPEWLEQDRQRIPQSKLSGELQPYEKELFRKDGSRVPVLVGAAMIEETGELGVAFVLDLTERRRSEEEARESERRFREVQMALVHANRVTTMGQLAASITHEIKQPIAANAANAQAGLRWLSAQPPALEEVRLAFDRILCDSRRAGEVMNRVHGLVKNAPTRTEPLQINDAIREVIALMRGEIDKHGISVRTRLAGNVPLVEADRVQVQQVMLNLIINAVEAMAESDEGPRDLFISTIKEESGGARVAVRDSGPGMTPQIVEHIFEPFYTTKADGMGMGLSLCCSIVQAHGGKLWANANEPRGSVFYFSLPVDSNSTL